MGVMPEGLGQGSERDPHALLPHLLHSQYTCRITESCSNFFFFFFFSFFLFLPK